MNIHIDSEEKNRLDNAVFCKFEVGSVLYGLETPESDRDFLSIYIPSKSEAFSFLWEHHQLQYKDNNIDYNYSSLQNFVRNILTGDSTINFELLFSEQLKESYMRFLYKNRKEFITYNVIKSYLGLAKRDLKMIKSFKTKEDFKKLSHAVRGIKFAEQLLKTNNLVLKDDSTFGFTEILKNIKCGEITEEKAREIKETYKKSMSILRNTLNEKLENGEIKRFGNPSFLKKLDEWVISIVELDFYDGDTLTDKYYDVLENGVKY